MPEYGVGAMAKTFPIHPANPHRVCWGCDKYCAADAMVCGNGSVRTPHPMELFGADWDTWNQGGPAQEAEQAEGAAESGE
jgi:hypothetical protein